MKRKSKLRNAWVDDMTALVDPETFVFMSNVYQAAASMVMPTENPESKALFSDGEGGTFTLKDIPMNRGMLAVVGELRKSNIKPEQAYLTRLMHMGEVFVEREKFAEFFKPSDEDGAMMVSEALLRACGVARLVLEAEHLGFDLDDVLMQARRIDAEDQASQ